MSLWLIVVDTLCLVGARANHLPSRSLATSYPATVPNHCPDSLDSLAMLLYAHTGTGRSPYSIAISSAAGLEGGVR